jgi:trans-aconitate methyltransferase
MDKTTAWNPSSYARNARFVSDLGEPLIDLLKPQSGESILDLGCGDGALTEKIASSGCEITGVDASLAQVEAAKKRGILAAVMDGHALAFRQKFDAVFTNAALHWMKQPEKVIAGVRECLNPGGRFADEFGGKGNVEKIRSALHQELRSRGIDPVAIDPWYYPSSEAYSGLLNRAGFAVDYIELIRRPTQLPGDIADWLEIFAQPFTKSVAQSERSAFIKKVCGKLAGSLKNPDGSWFADYVRLRFKASLKSE